MYDIKTFEKLPYFEFVPTPNLSRENREGLKLLYNEDFVPIPLFRKKR